MRTSGRGLKIDTMTGVARGRAFLAAGLALLMSACAAPRGDFDRPKPGIVNDAFLPMVGREFARGRGEPVSYAMLTDDEKELRDRSYRLVMPIHRRGFFARSRVELVRTRIWSDERYRPDPSLYYRKLRGDGFISSEARYNKIESDILADIPLIEPFYQVVRRVCFADASRIRALASTPHLTAAEEADATGRVYENARVIEWAQAALAWRIKSYAYAIQRQRIEIPSETAVASELALGRLAEEVAALAAAIAALECDARRWGPGVETIGGPLVVKG